MAGAPHLELVGGPSPTPSSVSTEQRAHRSAIAIVLLIAGAVLAVSLGWSTLTRPVVGSDSAIVGTPLADPSNVIIPTGNDASHPTDDRILVVWDADSSSPSSELQATYVVNLLGHFGVVNWAGAATVDQSTLDEADLVVYAGGLPGSTISPALAERVLTDTQPTLWLGPNLGQVADTEPGFESSFGWLPTAERITDAIEVAYGDTDLPRDTLASPLSGARVLDPARAEILATATTLSGDEIPYAIRSGSLTWFSENPAEWQNEADRGLVLADVLFDLLDPDRPVRHRGLVRLEDIGPWADPEVLRSIADGLSERGVPFTMAVYPIWRDPQAQYELGSDIRLADRPEVVEAIEYATDRGGTVIMHGVTHQHGETPNPYAGTSGEDFEFYRTHIDENDDVVYDGPIEGDSAEWIRAQIRQGFAEFEAAGLDLPTMFEFPHYAASAVDYAAIEDIFDARYERVTYPHGLLSGTEPGPLLQTDALPYSTIDIYGEFVIPENLGNVIPVGYNNNLPRDAATIVDSARRSLAVRDNVASFFFHPYLDAEPLFEIVDGMTGLGYAFVAPGDITPGD